jgi:hypothetical protein
VLPRQNEKITVNGTLNADQTTVYYELPVSEQATSVIVNLSVTSPDPRIQGPTSTTLILGSPSANQGTTTVTTSASGIQTSTTVRKSNSSSTWYIGVTRTPVVSPASTAGADPNSASFDMTALSGTGETDDSANDASFDISNDDSAPATAFAGSLSSDEITHASVRVNAGVFSFKLEIAQVIPVEADAATLLAGKSTLSAPVLSAADQALAFRRSEITSQGISDQIGNGGLSLTQVDGVLVLVSAGDSTNRALALRGSGPIAGALSEGPLTRTVDLRDAIAMELAQLLLDANAGQETGSDASKPLEGMLIEVSATGLEPGSSITIERFSQGIVLVGSQWPPSPGTGVVGDAPMSLFPAPGLLTSDAETEAMAAAENGLLPAEATDASQASESQAKTEREKGNALRTGLTIAYGLAFTFLLPDLAAFFQGWRRRLVGVPTNQARGRSRSWPRRGTPEI